MVTQDFFHPNNFTSVSDMNFLNQVVLATLFFTSLHANELLTPFKDLIEQGTYEGQDWSKFNTLPRSRYDTFNFAFDWFEQNEGKIVVELGTSRSFTHGGLIGCNNDNPFYWTPDQPENWDWGAGFFTMMAAICLQPLNPEIHTVDIVSGHLNRCKIMTAPYKEIINYHQSSSVDYLKNCIFPQGIDLLYLDTGDMTPLEPTALLQLEEAKIIVERDLISKNGIILIDDVKNQTPKKFGESSDLGKSKYALPFLLSNGYELIMNEYQVILLKK